MSFLIILPILLFIISPLSGKLSDRIGYRTLTSLGMIGIGCGLFLFSRLVPASPLSDVVIALVVTGIGTGVFNTPNSSAMMGAVSDSQRAVASGIMATNRNIGMSMGVALSTTMFAFYQAKNAYLQDADLIFVNSYRPVIYLSVSICVVGLILCLIRDKSAKTS